MNMNKVQRQFIDLDPNEDADDLWAFAVQCHLVGFVVGAIVATVVCWLAF